MAKNNTLVQARRQKNDEYYTRWCDIEEELVHYEDQLRGKSVICNCDDVEKSNFIEYLCRQAPYIGITKVIGVRYEGPDATESWYVTYTPPENIENYDADNWKDYLFKTHMTGNGGFETPESIELLDQCDVCVTNPPFSRYREFIDLLIKHDKKFLVISNMNCFAYKEIFKLIKENKIWCGYRPLNRDMYYNIPDSYKEEMLVNKKEGSAYKIIDGEIMGRLANACWMTNFEVSKRHEPLQLIFSMEHHDKPYEKYDNYEAYNVDKVTDIPYDSGDKILAVPLTFIGSYCIEQFEILWLASGHSKTSMPNDVKELVKANFELKSNLNTYGYGIINGKQIYHRILIRRRQEES